MKRIICISLCIVMVALLAGCSCSEEKKTQNTKETVAWDKGESLFGSKLREYAEAAKSSKKKDLKNKQKLSTGFGEVGEEKNLPERIGYTFVDLNGDGTEELLVSLIDKKDKLNNYIIAAYAYTGDGIKRLIEGWSRNTYHLIDKNYLLNEASGGADDAEVSKLHMRDLGFEYISSLAMKYGKNNKINYLYAEVGKPENNKKFRISKEAWQGKCKEWEDEVKTGDVKPISRFK